MIKCALFDFDGTLFDSMYVWNNLGKNYLLSKGITPDSGLNGEIDKLGLEEAAEYFQKRYGVTDSVEDILKDIKKMIRDEYERKIRPKWSAFRVTETLAFANVKLCILTSGDRDLVEKALFNYGMIRFFTMIMTCDDVGCGKYKPDIFLEARSLMRTDLNKTIVFEDSYIAAKTAKDAGFTVVGVVDDSEENQAGLREISDLYIDMRVEDPEAILDLLHQKCYIVGAGEKRGIDFKPTALDCTIAADGGLGYLEEMGLKPDYVVGDFDSYEKKPPRHAISLPPIKDMTDMAACVQVGADKGYSEFHIYGGTGGRIDHTIANIQLLTQLAAVDMRGYLYDGDRVLTVIRNDTLRFKKEAAGYISAFSLTDTTENVTEKALKYTLNEATLGNVFPLGVSNEFIGEESEISTGEGALLVVFPKGSLIEEKKSLTLG